MSRAEFTKPVKRAALKRSEGLCEAIGAWYNRSTRCNSPLALGVQFDHHILEANSHDNSLENCRAVCIKCHAWKTAHYDTPLAAKTLRTQDKSRGITSPKTKIASRPFQSRLKPDKGTRQANSHAEHLAKMAQKGGL